MISITRATKKDCKLLSELAKHTLLESHANSPAAKGLNDYVRKNYSEDVLKKELNDKKNIYHIIFYKDRSAGYSKIIFNKPYSQSVVKNITKLERLYLLEEFYDLKLGSKLFTFNVELSKKNKQSGMWLYTWKENKRAIKFYTNKGFTIIGSHDFKISETLFNPNHQMLLNFDE